MFSSIAKILTLVGSAVIAAPALAQPVPSLIHIIVPFAAGSSTDAMARAVAAQLGPRMKNQVVVENRAGGSGMIGAAAVAKGPRDGSMILFSSTSMITSAVTMKSMPLDPATELVPVSMLGEGPLVYAVSTSTNIKTPADFVAAARVRPDAMTHGTAGTGTLSHMSAELFNESAKVQLKHIPYKGAAQAVVDLAAGNINAMVAVNSTLLPQIQAGRVRLIGVTSDKPSPAFFNLQTMNTVAPGYTSYVWTAFFVASGTPMALVQRLNRDLNEVIKSDAALKKILDNDGVIPQSLTPEQTAARVKEEFATWKRIATIKNIVLE